MNGGKFRTNPLAHGASTLEKIAHVVDVKNDKDADGKPRFRAKVRIEGDQRDEAAIPDENLQWIRVEMPVNSFGSSPYLKPGMKVRIRDLGGTPGSTGMTPYISSIVSYQPTNPEDGQSSGATLKRKKGVGPRKEQPPPKEDFPNWIGGPWPTEATKTRESRRAGTGDTYVPGQTQNAAKAPHEDPNKNRHEETGTPSKAGGALTDDDTMGTQKRQDNPDFQKQIKGLIGNQGAFVPQALDMIMSMKKVTGMDNPKAIQAVGAGNLAGAIKALQGLFPKKKNTKDEPANPCALENRPNLTPEQLAECLELDALTGLAEAEKEGASSDTLYPPTVVEYETYAANTWNDQSANTIDSASYQAGIANVVSSLSTNTAFVANVATSISNSASLTTNTLILTNHTTPATSEAGGQVNNTIFFDENYIYCVMANGYIKRATLNIF